MAADRWWRPWVTALRTRWAILGAIIFVVVNYLLYSIEHPWWTEGFTGIYPGTFTPILLAIAFFILLFATIGRRGRSFGVGFVTAFAVLTVTSMGSCTRHWADPADYLRVYSKQGLNRTARRAELSEKDKRWVDSVRSAGVDPRWGAKRLLLVRSCMESFSRRDSTKRLLPPDSASVANQRGGCSDLDAYMGRQRSGWHWRYTPPSGENGFLLEGYPDPVLGLDGPLFELDTLGLVIQRERPGAPPMLAASPIAAMRQLRECVEFMLALPPPPGAKSSAPMTVYDMRTNKGAPPQCTELRDPPQQGVGAGDLNAVILFLPQDHLPKDAAMIYSLLYVPRDDGGREFDVHARPVSFPGGAVRSYLFTHSGQLHVTAENRAATVSDPAPEACELDLAVACPPR